MAIETRKVCDKCRQPGTDEDPVRTYTVTEEGGESWVVELHSKAHAEPMLKLARMGRQNRVPPPGVKSTPTSKLLEPRIRRGPDAAS